MSDEAHFNFKVIIIRNYSYLIDTNKNAITIQDKNIRYREYDTYN